MMIPGDRLGLNLYMAVLNISPRAIFLFFLLFCQPLSLLAQGSEPYMLIAEALNNSGGVDLHKLPWRYRAGDDMAWAAKDYDDRDWKLITNEQINTDLSSLGNWDGRAWFRFRLQSDDALAKQPLVFRVWHWGASEIYLDGKLIQRFGKIEPESDEEYNPRGLTVPVVLDGGAHTIAVRYSFKAASDFKQGRGGWLARGNYLPGFLFTIQPAQGTSLNIERRARAERLNYVFIGLLFALALVHLLLYVFYRSAPGNLYYSFFVSGISASLWLQSLTTTGHLGATAALLIDVVRQDVQTLAVISLLAFLYVEFAGRASRFFWVLVGLWIISLGLHAAQISRDLPYTLIMLIVTLGDCLRIVARALIKRRAGAWMIAAGVCVLVTGVAFNISIERDIIVIPEWLYQLNIIITILSVPLSVSIYLARNFARTNRHLADQLTQVQELSAREIEHQRTEAELRLQHEKERAENERRAEELEEARQLQLSMLPKKLPQLPNIDIAAYMKPATEVGGDYYDFHVGDDGTLTVAIGDATGHGLKAGTMVTATKSLFNNLAQESDIENIFKQSSAALKNMNLRGMFMGMTLLKLKDNRLTVSLAGMPAVLIYRNEIKRVEEISIKAMPLGSPLAAPFEQREMTLALGDCILLMSDGFPEMFNETGEMLGFDKAKRLLAVIADESAQEIINRFIAAGETWAGKRLPEDDVTFVVLKVGNGNGNSN